MNSKEKAEEIARKLELPRCPECGAKLSWLIQKSDVIEEFNFSVDGGDVSYTKLDESGYENLGYFCPFCSSKITSSEREAKELLKGKKEGGVRK